MTDVALPPLTDLLPRVRAIALQAGHAILEVYGRETFTVQTKGDESPLTEADLAADRIILPALRALTPDIPVVSEETVTEEHRTALPERFWLVDPLDGTKEFLKRNGEFTVNIALIEHGRPTLGVVSAPALGLLWYAAGPGTARAEREGGPARPIMIRKRPAEGLTVMASRSHADTDKLNTFLNGLHLPVHELRIAGSSLKFGLIAEGEADFYPRLGPTSEWDTAAGHAVLIAAGGRVTTLDGDDLRYGKPGLRNPPFVAHGDA